MVEKTQKEYFENIINSLDQPLYLVNAGNYKIEMVNKAFTNRFGEIKEGITCHELTHKRDNPCKGGDDICPLEEMKKTKSFVVVEHIHYDKSGNQRNVEVHGNPIFNEKGEITHFIEYSRDITDQRKAEKEIKNYGKQLEEANNELEKRAWGLAKTNEEIKTLYEELDRSNKELKKLDQLKSEFVSVVSHELRTPLTIIKDGIGLLLDKVVGELNEKQGKVLNTIKKDTERLANIINNLLDVSKIEAGKIELKRDSVNLTGLIGEILSAFSKRASDKGLKLKANLPGKQIDIYADEEKIIQVFTNLISNSLKFVEKGYIEISVVDKVDEVECSVTDTGIGIAEEDLPKVFGKFQQFGRVPGSGEQGTGLGLSIVKSLVELHQGRIWMESRIGKGTKFSFTLPKYTSDRIFKEYISNGIKEAMKNNQTMSIIVISIEAGFNFSKEEKDHILKDMEAVLKNGLRKEGDMMVKDSREMVTIIGCDKKEASVVRNRLEAAANAYIVEYNLIDKVKMRFSCATYPDDGRSDEELMTKAKEVNCE